MLNQGWRKCLQARRTRFDGQPGYSSAYSCICPVRGPLDLRHLTCFGSACIPKDDTPTSSARICDWTAPIIVGPLPDVLWVCSSHITLEYGVTSTSFGCGGWNTNLGLLEGFTSPPPPLNSAIDCVSIDNQMADRNWQRDGCQFWSFPHLLDWCLEQKIRSQRVLFESKSDLAPMIGRICYTTQCRLCAPFPVSKMLGLKGFTPPIRVSHAS